MTGRCKRAPSGGGVRADARPARRKRRTRWRRALGGACAGGAVGCCALGQGRVRPRGLFAKHRWHRPAAPADWSQTTPCGTRGAGFASFALSASGETPGRENRAVHQSAGSTARSATGRSLRPTCGRPFAEPPPAGSCQRRLSGDRAALWPQIAPGDAQSGQKRARRRRRIFANWALFSLASPKSRRGFPSPAWGSSSPSGAFSPRRSARSSGACFHSGAERFSTALRGLCGGIGPRSRLRSWIRVGFSLEARLIGVGSAAEAGGIRVGSALEARWEKAAFHGELCHVSAR